jgi:hypothetical protein
MVRLGACGLRRSRDSPPPTVSVPALPNPRDPPLPLLVRRPVRADDLRDVRSNELERRPQERLDALGPAPRAELLHVVMLPDFERADRNGEF